MNIWSAEVFEVVTRVQFVFDLKHDWYMDNHPSGFPAGKHKLFGGPANLQNDFKSQRQIKGQNQITVRVLLLGCTGFAISTITKALSPSGGLVHTWSISEVIELFPMFHIDRYTRRICPAGFRNLFSWLQKKTGDVAFYLSFVGIHCLPTRSRIKPTLSDSAFWEKPHCAKKIRVRSQYIPVAGALTIRF